MADLRHVQQSLMVEEEERGKEIEEVEEGRSRGGKRWNGRERKGKER